MFQHLLREEPLGPDALDQPTQEEVRVMWEAALAEPIPDYEVHVLGQMRRPTRE